MGYVLALKRSLSWWHKESEVAPCGRRPKLADGRTQPSRGVGEGGARLPRWAYRELGVLVVEAGLAVPRRQVGCSPPLPILDGCRASLHSIR